MSIDDDDERSVRPSTGTTTENVAKVRQAVTRVRRRAIRDVCEIKLSYGTCLHILSPWAQHKKHCSNICAQAAEQWAEGTPEHRVAVCSKLKEQTEKDFNFISTINTGDESWVYGYAPDTKQQSSLWKTLNSQRHKKADIPNNVKSMSICFFDTKGIVHMEFLPPPQTVKGELLLRRSEAGERNRTAQTSSQVAPCTTTCPPTRHSVCGSIWLQWKRQSALNLPTHQTSSPVIFSYFRKWNCSSRGDLLRALKIFWRNRTTWWRRWRKMTSTSSLKSRWDRCINAEEGYFKGDICK
jgi:hypothetical protein